MRHAGGPAKLLRVEAAPLSNLPLSQFGRGVKMPSHRLS